VFGVLKDKIGVLKDKGIELLKGQLDKIGKPRNRGGDGPSPGPPGMPPAGIESGNDGSSETSPQEPPVENYPQNHERGPPVGENNDVQNAVAQTSQEADYEDENFPVETPQIRDGNVFLAPNNHVETKRNLEIQASSTASLKSSVSSIVKMTKYGKKMSFEDTIQVAISKSKEYQEMVEEAKVWKNVVEAVADNGMEVSEIIMDAVSVVAASLYVRKLPILLNDKRACPSFFQWKRYRRSLSNMIFHLAKEDCRDCLNPKSTQYVGPVEAGAGTCGEPKYLNLNGVNKIDYYPPENCRPDPHTPLDIVLDSKTLTGSEEIPLVQAVFDQGVVSATVDCSSSNACLMLKKSCDHSTLRYAVKQQEKTVYLIEVEGLTYKIKPACRSVSLKRSRLKEAAVGSC